MIKIIKKSLEANSQTSSKRILMYIFAAVAIFMVVVQATFTPILMYKWAKAANGIVFEVRSVFPDVIWYCVFGLIGSLAGINGVVSGFGKKENKLETKEEEII